MSNSDDMVETEVDVAMKYTDAAAYAEVAATWAAAAAADWAARSAAAAYVDYAASAAADAAAYAEVAATWAAAAEIHNGKDLENND